MRTSAVALTFLLISFSNGLYRRAFNYFEIPEPQIETFRPKGLRISVDDMPDMRFVAFHINVNEMLYGHQPGEFYKEVLHPTDGRWVYELPDVRINHGDKIYYWIFVIRGRLGYKISREYMENKELLERPYMRNPYRPQVNSESCHSCTTSTIKTTEIPLEEPSVVPHQVFCEEVIVNLTSNLLSLQNEASTLRKRNQQLAVLLDGYPNAKKLKLSGRIPPDDDPKLTVSFILREKLEVNPRIISAMRNNDGSIDFIVSTVVEKIEVLEAAAEKLNNTKIVIS